MTPSEDAPLTEDFIIPQPSLTPADSPGVVYVSFSRTVPEEYATGTFACTLKFVSKEVDPTSGQPEEDGYDDEYQVEEIDLGAGDVSGSMRFCVKRRDTLTSFPLAFISTSHRTTSLSIANGNV